MKMQEAQRTKFRRESSRKSGSNRDINAQNQCCAEDTPLKTTTKKRSASKKAQVKAHPDHSAQLKRINRAIGQLEGVGRMIEERRYCPDILIQTRAIIAAVKSLENSILQTHLKHCVNEAFGAQNAKESEKKVQELLNILEKRL